MCVAIAKCRGSKYLVYVFHFVPTPTSLHWQLDMSNQF